MHAFHRAELLIGKGGVDNLRDARVAVIGVGGVGSYAAEALARAPIGHLVLIDDDRIVASNINRQIHAATHTVGDFKAEVMARRIRMINPQAEVVAITRRFTSNSADELLSDDLDYVVDAIDDVDAKVLLLQKCVVRSLPVVSSMGAASKLDPSAIRIDDISRSFFCPLARRVRKQLRRSGIETGIKVVYSIEPPILARTGDDQPASQSPQKTPLRGTISYLPPVFGFHCAATVIQDLLHSVAFQRQGESC